MIRKVKKLIRDFKIERERTRQLKIDLENLTDYGLLDRIEQSN